MNINEKRLQFPGHMLPRIISHERQCERNCSYNKVKTCVFYVPSSRVRSNMFYLKNVDTRMVPKHCVFRIKTIAKF